MLLREEKKHQKYLILVFIQLFKLFVNLFSISTSQVSLAKSFDMAMKISCRLLVFFYSFLKE